MLINTGADQQIAHSCFDDNSVYLLYICHVALLNNIFLMSTIFIIIFTEEGLHRGPSTP